jgi:hypothetical protein
MLRRISRRKTPWEKGEDHQSNSGDARKITYTRISHTKRIERRLCTTSKRLQQPEIWGESMDI